MEISKFLSDNKNINLDYVKNKYSLTLNEIINSTTPLKLKPKIQYIGGANFPNIGDKGLFECFKYLFYDCEVIFKNCSYPLTQEMADEESEAVMKNNWTDEQKQNKIASLQKNVMTIDPDVDLVVLVGGTSPPIWINFISHLLDKDIPCALFGTCFTNTFSYFDNVSNKTYKISITNYPKISYYINNIYNKAKIIAVRDIETKNIFYQYCKDTSKVILMGDPVMICSKYRYEYNTVTPSTAFTYPTVLSNGKYNLLDKDVCGIALGSEWKTTMELEEKIEFYRKILNILKDKFGTIKLFSFSETDYLFNQKVIEKVEGITLINEYKNYWAVLKEMRTCSIFIGERLHSIIISTSMSLPTVSLSYHDKCRSYMKTIKMEKWTLELNNDIDKFENTLHHLIDNAEEITKILDGNISFYQAKIYDVSRYIVDTLLSNYSINVHQILNTKITWGIKANIIDKYGVFDYNTLKEYIKENNLTADYNLNVTLEESFPKYYVDSRNYIIKYYDSSLNVIDNPLIDTTVLEETGHLSSYLINLENGYCSQKFKLNGYAGYNMFLDSDGNMLSNYLWYFGPCCWTWHHGKWRQHALRQFNNSVYYDTNVVCLLSNNNYGHFLHDIIASIKLIELENIGEHKIYLNTFNKTEYILSSLKSLGYTEDQIIDGNEVPFIRAKNIYLPVQQPRQVNWMKEWIRDKFRGVVPEQSITNRKIYIGRNNDNHRRIVNEHQLMDVLSKYNFEYIPTIRDLTFDETITLFKQCEFVAMSHGANCMNTHWCNENTNVIYITNEKLKAYHGYFKGCYTNDHINFYEYIGQSTDFDRDAYSQLYNVPVEYAYEDWFNNQSNTFPTKVTTYDDKWDMVVDLTTFEELVKSILSKV